MQPAIDLEHLAGFTDGDLELEGELAALYLSSAGVYLERMAEALAARRGGRGRPFLRPSPALIGAAGKRLWPQGRNQREQCAARRPQRQNPLDPDVHFACYLSGLVATRVTVPH